MYGILGNSSSIYSNMTSSYPNHNILYIIQELVTQQLSIYSQDFILSLAQKKKILFQYICIFYKYFSPDLTESYLHINFKFEHCVNNLDK